METYWIPISTKGINSEIPSHEIGNEYCSYANNCVFDKGVLKKRQGITTSHDFGTGNNILGYHRVDEAKALVAYGNSGVPTSAAIAEWNMVTGTGKSMLDKATGLSPLAEWQFCNHNDDTVGGITVCTNGLDAIKKYIHSSSTIADLISTTTKYKAKYPVSFYNALYLGNITDDGGGVNSDAYAMIWSEIGDASDFSVTQYYERRYEDGLPITSLAKVGDTLFMSKYSQGYGSVWAISPYANFKQQDATHGVTVHNGLIASRNYVYNMDGRILDLQGNWLSYPIHSFMASVKPGSWTDCGAVEDIYNEEYIFTFGSYMFVYKILQQSWEMYSFNNDIRVLSNLNPGRLASTMLPEIIDHTAFTVAEEDIMADYVIKYGNKLLCRRNHFFNDNNEDIFIDYRTPTTSCENSTIKKRFQVVTLQGKQESGQSFDIYGYFSDYPAARPAYESLGTVTINSSGYGELWIDKRGIWAGIKVTEKSQKPVELYKIGLKYKEHTNR